jgi:hypothetical protein
MASQPPFTELKSKYEEMLRMRLYDEAHPGGDPRGEMATLAARFPGALRELDEAPLDMIRARIEALSRCIESGAPSEPWMNATAEFHRLARGALVAKRWLAGRKKVDASVTEQFLRSLEGAPHEADASAWALDLDRIASPPRGKLTLLVFERLASRLGLSPGEAHDLVVGPPRRKQSGVT